MNTKSVPPVQAQAQDVVLSGRRRVVRLTAVAMWTELLEALRTDGPSFTYPNTLGPRASAVINSNAEYIVELTEKARDWQSMASAPVGDASACIDIWCGEDDCRRTDCFWEAETGRWVYEDFESGAYRTRGVKAPVAWMATPAKPEGV